MEFSVIGKRLPRLDAWDKATGEIEYGDDLDMTGLLYGRVLHSPHPHARILNIDCSKASKLIGVKGIITAKDIPDKKYGYIIPDELPLASDKVRFIGEQIAAVAATDPDTVEEALSLIDVEYEPLPAIFTPEEAMSENAPIIHDKPRNIASHLEFERGNIEQGFTESDLIFEDTFSTHPVMPSFLEPTVCIAYWDIHNKLTFWAPVLDPFILKFQMAKITGLSPSAVRLLQTNVGGSFGGKKETRIFYIAAYLSKKIRQPVKFLDSRGEEFLNIQPRVPMSISLRTGIKKDGTFLAKSVRIIADNGAYTLEGPAIMGSAAMRPDGLYRFRHLKTNADLVYTNNPPTGSFRGYGSPQGHFAVESQIDMISERLGIDPLELRLKNAFQQGDTTLHGNKILSCGLKECLDKAAEESGWREKRRNKEPNKGLGLACVMHVSGSRSFHNYNGSTAMLVLQEDGKVKLLTGEGEVGQGASTVLAQIAAEGVGVFLEDIDVAPVDTDVSPLGLGAWSSRLTYVGGNAVRLAALDARRQLLELASEKLEANIDDLDSKEGKVFVKGSPEKAIEIAELAKGALYKNNGAPIIGRGSYDSDSVAPDPKTKYGNLSGTYSFAAQIVEVEVDRDTGQVKTKRVVAAYDLGRAINPMLAEGQIEGGVAQGLGYALTEEVKLQAGQVKNSNFLDYRLPTAVEVGPITSILVETDDPSGPFGAKSVSEHSIVPTAAAVANAIYDASGVRIKDMPLCPEKILNGLRNRNPA